MKTLKELMDLTGRVALITGGAGHIGSAIGNALAELGAAIIVLDIEEETTKTARRIAQRWEVSAWPLVVDLSDDASVENVPGEIIRRCSRLDILVNCAAMIGTSDLKGWISPFEQQEITAWRQAIDINLTAAIFLVQNCAELLRQSSHGSVINVSSIYGMIGPDMRLYKDTHMGNPAAYAASKGGLIQMTRWLATVMAPDVRVNTISPGGIWRNQPTQFINKYVARTPLQRMGIEEDIIGAAAYLASDLSLYVTGHNLVVDGGWSVW
jgi:NAD(P)-dependent dehydrogenase (short-subunit alcohol dehydrogenase family)